MPGKTFRFSLQTVLDLRRRETEAAERALGRTVQARRSQEERLAAARRDRADACAETPAGALDSAALRRRAGHLRDLRSSEAAAARRLDAVRQQEAEARRTLVARRRPEEALKVLRDQHVSAFERARSKAETAFLDEQATTGHHRNQRAA